MFSKIMNVIKKIVNYDLIPVRFLPMTQLFIVINIAVFVCQILIPGVTDAYVYRADCWYSYITACFLHGSIGHLAGNMMFLCFIFPSIEERYGSFFIFIAYLFTGAFGSMFTALMDPLSMGLGASGSIMGVMMLWMFDNLMSFRVLLVPAALLYFANEGMRSGLQAIGFGDGIGHLAHYGSALGAFFLLPVMYLKRK